MKQRLRQILARAVKRLAPKPDQSTQLADARAREAFLTHKLAEIAEAEATREVERSFHSMVDDLVEARAMAGAGPWRVGPAVLEQTDKLVKSLRESFGGKLREDFSNTAGAYGDIELSLMTVDWRREINFSVLQFSRWGIAQIILIVRLYWLKNPIVRRLIDVCAAYVFARGVEVTTGDDAANETLKEFFEDNRGVFGQVALVQTERSKDTDGNVFWCLFPDKLKTGKVKARLIDATEIQEIISNPEDADEPWYYLRIWTQSAVSLPGGEISNTVQRAWYPAIGYEPDVKEPVVRGIPVMWGTATHHRKCGYVGKWMFGCPRAFPMVDWAKEARRYLEACASVAQQLAQIALTLTTKGGQQALMGAKAQLGTTEGPANQIWDSNPPAVAGAIFASGTGTKLEAFKTQGAGLDMEKVRQLKLMCAMTAGVPETFLADVSTGNLATATSLDRPTETIFLEKQESWVEDLTIISKFVLETSAQSSDGRLSESWKRAVSLKFVECGRHRLPSGRVVWEAFKKQPGKIEIKVNFPDIREGDRKSNVEALVAAMTLGNKAGLIIGIDEKVGVTAMYNALDIEGGEEKAEEQYPSSGPDKYDPNRSTEEQPPPIVRPKPQGGLQPTPAQVPDERNDVQPGVKEALARVKEALNGH